MSEKKRILEMGQASFEDYLRLFIQREPRYATKQLGAKSWRTKKKPLSDPPILAHLEGKYNVAVLGKYYPGYAIFDIDSRARKEADEIRERLGLDTFNSTLLKSESADSYHIYVIPEYHDKPPTLNLLKHVFENFGKLRRVEIYPQRGRPIRLPFGPHQLMLDPEYSQLGSWEEKLYWFEKLNPFDLSSVKYHQRILDFAPGPGRLELPTNIFQEAQDLLAHGLQFPSTRHDSQGLILFYLFRQNVPAENAVEIVWDWINKKHNGFSKDIRRSPRYVKRDIESQANFYWRTYLVDQVYPDSTHNIHHGYITKPDLPDIVEATQGSLPRMKFLFNLVKYSYPRRLRRLVSIHRDKLIRWASDRTYLKYLDELGTKGIAERRESYLSGLYAKDLKLTWKYRSSNEAVLYDGRAIDTFEDTIRLLFKHSPGEFRQLLIKAGVKQSTASMILNSIWREK